MDYTCPKDSTHRSDDPDYCSVCGAKIAAAPLAAQTGAAPAAVQNSAAGGDLCPDCGLARPAGAKFCEVCRFNFETRSSAGPTAMPPEPPLAPVPAPTPAPTPAFSAAPTSPLPQTPGTIRGWEAVVTVDPALYTDPDPAVPCPVGEPERTFPLDLTENLIGRRSDRRDIHPEVPLGDSGVSHRHAKILRQPDGSLVLLELGSTNGTRLNDVEVPAGVRTPLHDGDRITLGCWTRLTIRALGGG